MPEANVRERIDGYAAFVRKPFQLAALVQLVAAILDASEPGAQGTPPSPNSEPPAARDG